MPTQAAAPGITRFDIDERQGYMVRIRRHGNQTNEFYSDKKNGGKRKALAVAKARYAELCDELGPVESPTKDLLTHRNSTGAVGVHIASSYETRWASNEYFAYCASWTTADGARKKINFSWNKYGKKEAFELACVARQHEINDRDEVLALREKAKLRDKKNAKRRATAKKAKLSAKRRAK